MPWHTRTVLEIRPRAWIFPISAEIVNILCQLFIIMLRRFDLQVLSVYSGISYVERLIYDRVCAPNGDEFKGDVATTFALECTDNGTETKLGTKPFLPVIALDARIAVMRTRAGVVMAVWPRAKDLLQVLNNIDDNPHIHTFVFIGEDCSGMRVVTDFMYDGAPTWREVERGRPYALRQLGPGSTSNVYSTLLVYTRLRAWDGDSGEFWKQCAPE